MDSAMLSSVKQNNAVDSLYKCKVTSATHLEEEHRNKLSHEFQAVERNISSFQIKPPSLPSPPSLEIYSNSWLYNQQGKKRILENYENKSVNDI